MTTDRDDDAALEAAFADLRAATPQAPDGLRAAVLRDAADVQAGFPRPGVADRPAASPLRVLWATLGGWAGGAALAGAAVAGIAIGAAETGPVASFTASYLATDMGDLFGGYAAILEES